MGKSIKYRSALMAFTTVVALGFGLTGSVSAAAVATISDTGPDSYNSIEWQNKTTVNIDNDNKINIVNNNSQSAKSGDASVSHNTNGGNANTGDASNYSEFSSKVSIDNQTDIEALKNNLGDNSASIENTGPDSTNKIEFENMLDCKESNYNNVSAYNNNNQSSITGNARVGSEGWMFNWNNWSPENWKANGADYDSWKNDFEGWLNESAKPWQGDNSNNKLPIKSWNESNPLVWKSNGYSYEQWKSNLDTYLNNHKNIWKNGWGNTNAGNAVSGNASNYSTALFSVDISNRNYCVSDIKENEENNAPTNPGSPAQPGQGAWQPLPQYSPMAGMGALGFNDEPIFGLGEMAYGNLGGFVAGPSDYPTVSPSSPSQPGKGGDKQPSKGDNFTINNTGPDSYNKITSSNFSSYDIDNNNCVSISNNNSQYSSSGNASVSDNTNAGSAASGDSTNHSVFTSYVTIKN